MNSPIITLLIITGIVFLGLSEFSQAEAVREFTLNNIICEKILKGNWDGTDGSKTNGVCTMNGVKTTYAIMNIPSEVTLVITGSGNLFNYGTITNNGTITVNNSDGIGIYNFGGTITNDGTITVNNSDDSYGIDNSYGTINNSGTITVNNSDGIGIYNYGSSTITNNGTITVNNSGLSVSIDNYGTITNDGTITVNNSGGIYGIYNYGTITNNQTICDTNLPTTSLPGTYDGIAQSGNALVACV